FPGAISFSRRDAREAIPGTASSSYETVPLAGRAQDPACRAVSLASARLVALAPARSRRGWTFRYLLLNFEWRHHPSSRTMPDPAAPTRRRLMCPLDWTRGGDGLATRRTFLQVGYSGLLGLGLPGLLAARAAASNGAVPGRARSVIVILLSGGLGQHDSFD